MTSSFKKLTTQDKIAAVAKRWGESYRDDFIFRVRLDTDTPKLPKTARDIRKALEDLPANATEEEVAAIIGNSSWTDLTCDVCHSKVSKVVAVDVTYREYSTQICQDCLTDMQRCIEE